MKKRNNLQEKSVYFRIFIWFSNFILNTLYYIQSCQMEDKQMEIMQI